MPKTVASTKGKLQKETEKLAKKTAAAKGYKPHSLKRRYAKVQIAKLRGRISQLTDLLAKLIKRNYKQGPHAAVRWALSQQGVTEHPSGSNWGEPVESWIKNTGYNEPEPWCGCFASEAVINHGKAKVPDRNRCGYGPNVIHDAESHQNGFVAVPFDEARPGDYLVFFNGEHQGMARTYPSNGTIGTIEGNTSPSSSGSQFNGGCVAAKTRSRSDVSVVARPAYPTS